MDKRKGPKFKYKKEMKKLYYSLIDWYPMIDGYCVFIPMLCDYVGILF